MVNWVRLKSGDVLNKLRTIEMPGAKVLSFLRPDIYEEPNVTIHNDEESVEMNMKELVAPLGKVGRMLVKNDRLDVVKDVMRTYWSEQGNSDPKFIFDTISTDEGDVTLRNKIVFKSNQKDTSLTDFFTKVKPENYKDFDEVVLGGEGDSAEVQFLSTIKGRIEARPNDFLDAGIFVHINGSVKVCAGVNRLVCTNGLTTRFNIWSNDEFDFLRGDSIFKQGYALATWFATKANQPIDNVREISSAFGHAYPKNILNRKWKEWSEKVELRTLTWFDVINDITSIANRTLSGLRYKLLESGMLVQKMETTGCCPTCSHKI